jgi:hypothetical protein
MCEFGQEMVLDGARKRAIAAFDRIWSFGDIEDRRAAKSWLARQLEIPVGDCYIGFFDIEMCRKVVEICLDRNEI